MTRLNEPFSLVPLSLARAVSPGDVLVYMAIDYRCGKRGFWRGVQAELAAMLAISERTVERAVANLRSAGYIETKRIDGGLRYMVVARSVDADEADPPANIGGNPPAKSDAVSRQTDRALPPAVARAYKDARAHSQPSSQDPSQDHDQRARPTTAEGWYERTSGRRAHNVTIREILRGIDAAHPAACVAWSFEQAAAAREPWTYAKRILDTCGVSGEHNPRAVAKPTRGPVPRRAKEAGGRW